MILLVSLDIYNTSYPLSPPPHLEERAKPESGPMHFSVGERFVLSICSGLVCGGFLFAFLFFFF